jgi:tetratricopeptide (TPR) repeat protein
MDEAERFKQLGNTSFKDRKYEEAVEHYNKAIQLDPSNHVLYCNRSLCFEHLKR